MMELAAGQMQVLEVLSNTKVGLQLQVVLLSVVLTVPSLYLLIEPQAKHFPSIMIELATGQTQALVVLSNINVLLH